MSRSDEPVNLGPARFVVATNDAIKVVPAYDNDAFDGALWVPKSQIHDDSEVFAGMDGDEGLLVVNHWWAETKGLV